jgi:2-oxoglutarate dehydrogenase E1 component
VRDFIQPLLDESRRTLRYAGRPESASPSTGSLRRHLEETAEFVEAAFTGAASSATRRRAPVARKKK